MYTPKYFSPQEFVDPETFEARGNKSIELIDDLLFWIKQ